MGDGHLRQRGADVLDGEVPQRYPPDNPPGSERTRHWSAARQAWASTGREDLVESVSAEFE
jgi:hypothetical protein